MRLHVNCNYLVFLREEKIAVSYQRRLHSRKGTFRLDFTSAHVLQLFEKHINSLTNQINLLTLTLLCLVHIRKQCVAVWHFYWLSVEPIVSRHGLNF